MSDNDIITTAEWQQLRNAAKPYGGSIVVTVPDVTVCLPGYPVGWVDRGTPQEADFYRTMRRRVYALRAADLGVTVEQLEALDDQD